MVVKGGSLMGRDIPGGPVVENLFCNAGCRLDPLVGN